MIFALLPIICFVLLYIFIFQKVPFDFSKRSSFLLAAVIWGCLVVFATETIGLTHQISSNTFLIFWLSIILLLLFAIPKKSRIDIKFNTYPLSRFEIFALLGMVIIAIATFLIAFVCPPNNYDSMTYHLTRVSHWIQNGYIGAYPTHDPRQLTFPPWSEYAILHFQILTQSDRLANLVQWFSMTASLFGVSLIAKLFGADRRGQILAAAFCASLPMGILQSTNTKNDYTASFWLICFVYFLLELRSRPNKIFLWSAGASLGLSLLSKTTAYLYTLPILLWYVIIERKKLRYKLIQHALIMALAALLINGLHYHRNLKTCGHPLACPQMIDESSNENMSLPLLASNVVRNIGLHWGTPFKNFNQAVIKAVDRIHLWLGTDINDPLITYQSNKFNLGGYTFHEDYAGNFLHHLIILFVFIILLIQYKSYDTPIKSYALSLLAGFILLNLYIKWMPWGTRYQLPLFVLAAPIIGLVSAPKKYSNGWNVIFTVLILTSFLWIFHNQTRPILGGERTILNTSRNDKYFLATPGFKDSYEGVTSDIILADCYQIGLTFKELSWEYPLWMMLKESGSKNIRLEAIDADNPSGKFVKADFLPCAIVDNKVGTEIIHFRGNIYALSKKYPVLNLYLKK